MSQHTYPKCYFHANSQSYVIAMSECDCTSDNRAETSVIYWNLDTGVQHYQEVTEFYDGRFAIVDAIPLLTASLSRSERVI